MVSVNLNQEQISRIIEMAWEDKTTFEAIQRNFGLTESDVIKLMRSQLKPSSFALWRKRVTGRTSKHAGLRDYKVTKAFSPSQYKVTR